MKMAKISILIPLLSHLLCVMAQRQPSPCSEYFTYMTKPGITDMLGQIEIRPPSANDTFFLKVALDTTTGWPSQVARLELSRSIQESLRNVYHGKPLLYHVYYRLTREPIPSLSAIWFNNQRYCASYDVSGNITATIELGHILYSSNEEPLLYNYGPWQLNSLPWHRNSSTYRIDNPSYDRLNFESQLNNECGITSYYTDDTNRLISDGEKTLPGQWPWFVAIYIQRTDNESVYDFKCAGSLLTNRHVLTVKECIVVWNQTVSMITPIELQRVYVSFGQFNSREWHWNHTGIINRMIVNYTTSSISTWNGLAILTLKTVVEYNAFIRPICLWSGSTDLQDIRNMTGYEVGWGEGETGNWWHILLKIYFRSRGASEIYWGPYTGIPRMRKVPLTNLIVSNVWHIDILYTVPITYVDQIMDNVTTYPCYTDRGGGLVLFNTTMGRYQLRGVVTRCSKHMTYYDVAKHMSWIRQQISIT